MALVLSLFLALAAPAAAQQQWAVLAQGSHGYDNYRHQADLCHAYKLLLERGFQKEKIITMAYDDIAWDEANPFAGKLFNKPAKTLKQAVDVYPGCVPDYNGEQVTPDAFVGVLTGDEKLAGGKKVLRSTAEDHVFVYFVDHGDTGLIMFPDVNSSVLHAKRLVDTLGEMHKKGLYKQLLFYLETCESGSMFEGLLPKDLPVYAVTAAGKDESSFGAYCLNDAVVAGKDMGTCLGDLFSVTWLHDTEANGKETLGQQFARVKKAVNTSTVTAYGEAKAFADMPISDFEGPGARASSSSSTPESFVASRDVRLRHLFQQYERTGSPAVGERLTKEIQARSAAKALGQRLTKAVPEALGATFGAWSAPLLECHERAVAAFGSSCGWTEHRLVLSKALYGLCAAGGVEKALEAVGAACKPAQAELVV